MKKTFKIKDNQNLIFYDVKTNKEYRDTRKDLMTENFNNNLNIKHLSTWKYGEPKKLAESRFFDYLSDDIFPIRENRRATRFLNSLHFIEDKKINKRHGKLKELRTNHKCPSIRKSNDGINENTTVPYYLVRLKKTSEYLSFDKNGEGILTDNKYDAEVFVSTKAAKEAIERFIFDSIDINWDNHIPDESSYESVDKIIAESISDFEIYPIHDIELREALKKRFKKTKNLKEKSVRSVLNDVAFYIVSIHSDNTSNIEYIGKDDADNFITTEYKDLSEVFETKEDAEVAIDDMIYQELDKMNLDSDNMTDEKEEELYNELLQNYTIEAIYIPIDSLYYKPLNQKSF